MDSIAASYKCKNTRHVKELQDPLLQLLSLRLYKRLLHLEEALTFHFQCSERPLSRHSRNGKVSNLKPVESAWVLLNSALKLLAVLNLLMVSRRLLLRSFGCSSLISFNARC